MNSIQLNQIFNTQDSSLAIELLGKHYSGQEQLPSAMLIQLSYIRMQSLSAERLILLLQESTLLAYQVNNFDLYQHLKNYLEQVEYLPSTIELCKEIANLFLNNNELLAEQPFTVGDKSIKPSVGNYLKNYISFSSEDAFNRDALSVVQFFSNSPSVKILSDFNQWVLKNLIQIFNLCQQLVQMWDLLPDKISSEDLPEGFDQETINKILLGYNETEALDDSVQNNLPFQTTVSDIGRSDIPNKQQEIDQKLENLKQRQRPK